MSGECDACGEHALECTCRPISCPPENDPKYTGATLAMGIDPPANLPARKQINVRGREEHESYLRDPAKCKELGLDQTYEILVYLKRWGGWLRD